MFKRILVLLSGSDSDRHALEYGVGLARSTAAQTHIIAVIEIPAISTTIDEVKDIEDDRRDVLQKALTNARNFAAGHGQPVTTELLVGPLVETVTRSIQSRQSDLLVIGETNDSFERGHRALAHKAPCPVFVAREAVIQEFLGEPAHRTERWEVRRDKRERLEGNGLMLQVFVGESDRWQGRPVYEAMVERLRELDIAGATVFAGDLGFGDTRQLHAASRNPWSHDRPMVVTVVDTRQAAQRAIEAISDLLTDGLIVTSDVEIIKYAHRRAASDAVAS